MRARASACREEASYEASSAISRRGFPDAGERYQDRTHRRPHLEALTEAQRDRIGVERRMRSRQDREDGCHPLDRLGREGRPRPARSRQRHQLGRLDLLADRSAPPEAWALIVRLRLRGRSMERCCAQIHVTAVEAALRAPLSVAVRRTLVTAEVPLGRMKVPKIGTPYCNFISLLEDLRNLLHLTPVRWMLKKF